MPSYASTKTIKEEAVCDAHTRICLGQHSPSCWAPDRDNLQGERPAGPAAPSAPSPVAHHGACDFQLSSLRRYRLDSYTRNRQNKTNLYDPRTETGKGKQANVFFSSVCCSLDEALPLLLCEDVFSTTWDRMCTLLGFTVFNCC